MLVKDISLKTPQENILYDEVLLQLAQENKKDQTLRFWESGEYFVCLGRIGQPQEDVYMDRLHRDKTKLLRRASGGGTVVQGKGCLNYTLILSKNHKEISDLKRSYVHILDKIVAALKQLDIDCDYYPVSDIALRASKKKISGNAQKRGRSHVMHHGTILIDFDLGRINHYLKIPKDMPEYRDHRSHLDFISNIHVDRNELKKKITNEFNADSYEDSVTDEEEGLLKDLLAKKEVFIAEACRNSGTNCYLWFYFFVSSLIYNELRSIFVIIS